MSINTFINRILGQAGLALVRKESIQRLATMPAENQAMADLHGLLRKVGQSLEDKHKQLLRHQIHLKWSTVDLLEGLYPAPSELVCPLCGYHSQMTGFGQFVTNCIFEGGTLTRHQCPECDLIFGDQKMLRLTEAELSRDYEWHYQVFTEGDSTAQEIRAFHNLAPQKGGTYLNWGAGAWSKTLTILRQEGWDVYGYEPHSSATQQAGSPHIISSMAQLSQMQFDGIFSNNVLEHFRHPVQELSSMGELLKPDGKMSHATPCFEYLYEFTRFHLFFYLGRSRALLAQQAGLHSEDFLVDGEFMNMILRKA